MILIPALCFTGFPLLCYPPALQGIAFLVSQYLSIEKSHTDITNISWSAYSSPHYVSISWCVNISISTGFPPFCLCATLHCTFPVFSSLSLSYYFSTSHLMASLVQSSIYLDISIYRYPHIYKASTFQFICYPSWFYCTFPYLQLHLIILILLYQRYLLVSLVLFSIYLDISMCPCLNIYRVSTFLFICYPSRFHCTFPVFSFISLCWYFSIKTSHGLSLILIISRYLSVSISRYYRVPHFCLHATLQGFIVPPNLCSPSPASCCLQVHCAAVPAVCLFALPAILKPVLLQQLVCSVRCSSQLHWLVRVCMY